MPPDLCEVLDLFVLLCLCVLVSFCVQITLSKLNFFFFLLSSLFFSYVSEIVFIKKFIVVAQGINFASESIWMNILISVIVRIKIIMQLR